MKAARRSIRRFRLFRSLITASMIQANFDPQNAKLIPTLEAKQQAPSPSPDRRVGVELLGHTG